MSSNGSGLRRIGRVAVPLSTVFCADDADVIVRAAGTRDFRVHKPMLSFVSSVFKAMFTHPQPPIDTLDTLQHVDVEGSAETWENILRTIYPMPNPIIDNLHNLESLFLAALKYKIKPIIDIYKTDLENRVFIREDPLRLYAIACACGLEDQAKHVARNAELATVTRRSNAGDLMGLTVGSYHNLVSFLTRRDNQWRQIFASTRIPEYIHCKCDKSTLYAKIKKDLRVSYLQTEEIYLKALEERSRSRQSGCRGNCSIGDLEIKAFIEGAVKGREELCNKLISGTLVPRLITPYSKVPYQKLGFAVHSHMSLSLIFGHVSLSLVFSCVILWLFLLYPALFTY